MSYKDKESQKEYQRRYYQTRQTRLKPLKDGGLSEMQKLQGDLSRLDTDEPLPYQLGPLDPGTALWEAVKGTGECPCGCQKGRYFKA